MNNTGNESNLDNQVDQIVLILFSVPTFFIGSALNGTALCLICSHIKLAKPFIYLVNLIASDTLLLFSLPFKIYAYYLKDNWSRKMEMSFCQFLESLYFVNTYTSILVITVICVDRFVAVRHPFVARAKSSPRAIGGICASIWIAVGLCTIHIYFTSHSKSCFYRLSSNLLNIAFIAPFGALFFICALTMLFCSLQIIHSLNSQTSDTQKRRTDKCAKIVLSNLFTFLICFTPYHALLLLYVSAVNGYFSKQHSEWLRRALHYSLCLANVNCCLDAIYYFYAIKELQPRMQTPGKTVQPAISDS
ncbi:G-protein coupled receptor 35-like [Narcine bancroftii]|uniref:G-protein coupled receptor 35-like n=1 Tax=Narcine bancroftii TaxID=1343680 RepID=UPI0038319A39